MLSLFAVHASNRFVHVSEVERGLACNCRCAICGETVIARQGEQREHHFAHASDAEPCEPSHESDLHRFAKRVVTEALGLVVPVTTAASLALGFGGRLEPSLLLACTSIQEEVLIGDYRPDLLAVTTAGVSVAIEIAYSSFCDAAKRQAYRSLQLPALEIDLRAFTPAAFDVTQVKRAVLEGLEGKSWLWPEHLDGGLELAPGSPPRQFLPEEIVTVHGRWISVKQLPSGDLAMKAVRYDPDVVSLVRTVARSHFGRYRQTHHSWLIPRFRADDARLQLRALAAEAGSKPWSA